jgi:hypothetical protein
MLERFFLRWVARNVVICAALATGIEKDLSVNAAPTTAMFRRWRSRRRQISWRWWWRRRRTYRRRTTRTTWQRPIPTRRWLRRAWRMWAWGSTPFVTTATRFPTPSAPVLFPNPLATFVIPLSARDADRRHLERVLVAVLGDSVTDDDAGITDRSRDSKSFEVGLRKIAERVEIVHLVADIKKRVLGIVSCRGRPDDHSGGVLAVAGNVVRGGCVTTQCSQVGNGVCELALSL